MAKKAVLRYWEGKFRLEAAQLSSLKYFCPTIMSLSSPHPLWVSASSSSYEISKATVQARMLSGRYRTESLSSHWSSNSNGWCLTPLCVGEKVVEDLDHILSSCPSLDQTRRNLQFFTRKFAASNPIILPVLEAFCNPEHPLFCQFLLDCSCIPAVNALACYYGATFLDKLFYIGRTWCYSLLRDRARLLNRWHL